MNRFARSAVFSALVSCLAAPAMAALPDSGMWTIDGELNGKPGRGIQIDRQSGLNVIVTYYGYRTDGSALFLQAAGQLKDEKIFEGSWPNTRAVACWEVRRRTAKLHKSWALFASSSTLRHRRPSRSPAKPLN